MLLSLPLDHIFKYLSARDLCNLQVSKDLRQKIAPKLWHIVYLSFHDDCRPLPRYQICHDESLKLAHELDSIQHYIKIDKSAAKSFMHYISATGVVMKHTDRLVVSHPYFATDNFGYKFDTEKFTTNDAIVWVIHSLPKLFPNISRLELESDVTKSTVLSRMGSKNWKIKLDKKLKFDRKQRLDNKLEKLDKLTRRLRVSEDQKVAVIPRILIEFENVTRHLTLNIHGYVEHLKLDLIAYDSLSLQVYDDCPALDLPPGLQRFSFTMINSTLGVLSERFRDCKSIRMLHLDPMYQVPDLNWIPESVEDLALYGDGVPDRIMQGISRLSVTTQDWSVLQRLKCPNLVYLKVRQHHRGLQLPLQVAQYLRFISPGVRELECINMSQKSVDTFVNETLWMIDKLSIVDIY